MKSKTLEWIAISSIILLTATLSIWAGLSLLLLTLIFWFIQRQLTTSTRSGLGFSTENEDKLALSLGKLRSNPYEGEIFGLNSRVQSEVRDALDSLSGLDESLGKKSGWILVLPILFIATQSVATLGVIAFSSVRFEGWGTIALLALPLIAFQLLAKSHESKR